MLTSVHSTFSKDLFKQNKCIGQRYWDLFSQLSCTMSETDTTSWWEEEPGWGHPQDDT